MAVLGSRRRLILLAATLVVAALGFASLRRDDAWWRVQVLILKSTGRIPDVGWVELVTSLGPRPEVWLAPLAESPNPYASIRNKWTAPGDVRRGGELFRERCAGCHGLDGRGRGAVPALVGRTYSHGESDWAVYRTIAHGVAGTPMQPQGLTPHQIWQVEAHVRSLQTGAEMTGPVSSAALGAGFDLPFRELRAATVAGRDWLTYSGSYAGTRHSQLSEISPANVARLAPRWMYQFRGVAERIETTPIVRDGIMFVTAPPGRVIALDAVTGGELWVFDRPAPADVRIQFAVNRGVAVLDDKVFVGTLDAHLLALSARTGAVVWDATVANYRDGYGINSAPLAVNGLIVTGASGGDFPTRGFIAAYDARTGEQRWRFATIPEPGQPGSDTWSGDSWRTGGSAAWLTGSYDPDHDLVYWGIGNPAPDHYAAARAGDNLYSDSVVALHGATGTLAWHFQFTPADDHDWDSGQIPVLATRASGTRSALQLLWANRNGFFYVIDAGAGHFVRASPFARVTWAARIDEAGRPVLLPNATPSSAGTLVYPSVTGATSWWSPSYDPALDLMFVPTLEYASLFYLGGPPKPRTSTLFLGSSTQGSPGIPLYTAVRAIDPADGTVRWEYRRPARLTTAEMGGLLSTRAGLVFGGDLTTFFALDSRGGKLLWSFPTGGRIAAAPVTYMAGGAQQVAITAGRTLIAFGLPRAE